MVTGQGPQAQAIYDGYAFIATQIDRLWAQAGADTNLLLLSDHGFGPICATPAALTEWLGQQGFTQLLPGRRQSWPQRLVSAIYGWSRRWLSESFKEQLRQRLPGVRNRVESDVRFGGIDWSRTQAYAGPSPYEVWLNCAGREPQGIVTSAEYDAVRQQVMTALRQWSDPATGRPRIRAVYGREERYRGRYLSLAPDITIEWDPTIAPPAHTLPGNHSQFDADHQPEGILLMLGPDIRPGSQVEGATLADVAPTILHLLGITPADPLDGRVLHELFKQ